jgi:hypothetical protein
MFHDGELNFTALETKNRTSQYVNSHILNVLNNQDGAHGTDFMQPAAMEEKNYTGTIPGQRDGKLINAESVAELTDIQSARRLFATAKQKLLDVNGWQKLAGEALAGFQLTDEAGNEVSGLVKTGYHFRIDIPGPGTVGGDGFDWVKVEAVEDYASGETESTGIRVRPAANPTSSEESTAHFYSDQSTSTFIVTREGDKVIASVSDRNIKPNTDAEGVIDQVRNSVVGTAGMYSFSKIQWKSLTDGLLSQDI